MNCVQLIGNLTKDPELRYTQGGKAFCSFTVANNDNKEYPVFILCQAWEKTAEIIAEHHSKGDKIAVTGSLSQFDVGEGDKKTRKTQVRVSRITFCKSNNNDAEREPTPGSGSGSPGDDDLPF